MPTSKPKGLRVYSCSHSFHNFVHDILSDIAATAGIKDHGPLGVWMIGGSRVIQFWDAPDDKNEVKTKLGAGAIDVLMLSPIWLPEEGIEKLAKLAVEHKPDVRVTVQEYWLPNDEYVPVYPLQVGKQYDRDATPIKDLKAAQDRYDKDIDDHVRGINKSLGKSTIQIVPVGQAVVTLRKKIIAGEAPGIEKQTELFSDTWGHPTIPVQVLNAYCHFAVIYKQNPFGLAMPKALAEAPQESWRNEKLNRLLQELAWDAVTRHPLSGLAAEKKRK